MSDEIAPADLAYLQEYTGGDPDAIKELLVFFYESVDEAMGELEANVVAGESSTWSEAAHKLKGAAAYVGAKSLRSLCAKAQDMKVASVAERSELFEGIKVEYQSVKSFLEEKVE